MRELSALEAHLSCPPLHVSLAPSHWPSFLAPILAPLTILPSALVSISEPLSVLIQNMFLLRTYWMLHMGFRNNPDTWFVLAQWLNCKSLRAAFHLCLPPRVCLGQTGGSSVGQSVFVCVICSCHVASLSAKAKPKLISANVQHLHFSSVIAPTLSLKLFHNL